MRTFAVLISPRTGEGKFLTQKKLPNGPLIPFA